MIIYGILAIVTIALSLFVKNRDIKISYGYSRQQVLNGVCLISVFLLLFGVSALRLNVGNDYAKYVEFFHLIRCKLDTDVVVPTEFGFNLICLLIYFVSGKTENYLLMFAFFAFVTIFLFLKAMYKQADSFGFTFFLFMTLGYYFQTFSTVRYYLALAMAVIAIPYVIKKKWINFILICLLGATIHKSMLIVIPLYFLAQIKWNKIFTFLVLLVSASFLIFQNFYMEIFLKVYPTYEETEYLEGGTSYISIVRCVAVLILSLALYEKTVKNSERNRFYFVCNIGALILYTCCSFLPVISRVGYYLTITQIFFIPSLIMGIENKKIRKVITVLVVLAAIGYFLIFLVIKAPQDGLRILPYETFLYHDMVPILSDVS
ncbi:MAG: EpsG family protein [Lachnospiraceae bacterium]|nr:EpsG family protein [Lachnospiraceae bacterium]